MHFAWPLTGRSQEMRLIEAALADPASSGIVVGGWAGVGKSRIAREALAGAASRGWEVRWVVGTTSGRGLPLGALASWAGSTGPDTLQLVRGVIEALTSTPGSRPVAVGVDDAHLLDDLSAFVLHQIVQHRSAKLVLTVRDGEPVPAAVQEVWRSGQFKRLDLQPLSRDETLALLSATLSASLDSQAAQRLWKLTHGNVLYLRNIVEHEVAGGRLAQQQNSWRWVGEPMVPLDLVDMVESRIGALPDSVSDVLDALAVAEPLELATLTRITASAAIEEADIRGLITLEPVDGGVEVRLAHPLYGEVRRRRAAPTRLRRLRGIVAADLADSDDADDIRMIVRRAALTIDSDLPPDPELLTRAAKGAVWLGDHGLAERLANGAIRAGASGEANLIRAHALTWLARGKEADEVFADVDTSDFTDDERAALAFARAATVLGSLGDPAGAMTLINEVARKIPPEAHSSIDAYRIVHWAAMGKPELAIEAANSVALDQLPDIVGALPAHFLVIALGGAGRTSEAMIAAEAGYTRMDRSLDSGGVRCCIGHSLVRALLLAGLVSDAVDVSNRLRDQATADLPGSTQILSSGVAGIAAHGAGHLHTAHETLEKVLAGFAIAGDFNGLEYLYHPVRTMALAMRGLTDEAVGALATLEDRRHPSWRFLDGDRGVAQAWVAACQGAVSEAVATALSSAETARENGQFAVEVLCLQTATQFGDRSCASRLRELEAIVEGPRVEVAARFAAALQSGDGAELAAVSEDFERMGDLVAAVDAAAHAALACRRQDRRGKALGCSTRAEALAEECGGACTPALRRASEKLPLSDRELEIVSLLAHGLSSPAIAERLTLSRRTVEGHIYRAMVKTETSSREELAALLHRRAGVQ